MTLEDLKEKYGPFERMLKPVEMDIQWLISEVERLQKGMDEAVDWLSAVHQCRRKKNGEYPHLLICSGDRNSPREDCSICQTKKERKLSSRVKELEGGIRRFKNRDDKETSYYEETLLSSNYDEVEADKELYKLIEGK